MTPNETCVVCGLPIDGRWLHHSRLNSTWHAYHKPEEVTYALHEDVYTHTLFWGWGDG